MICMVNLKTSLNYFQRGFLYLEVPCIHEINAQYVWHIAI